MKKLVLIDGNAMMHRAFHAMPDLTNNKGEPINAVYGFFSMLLNVFHEQQPDYLAVCFDKSKPTIRQSMYAGYHAHRPEMVSDLSLQFPIVHSLLKTMNVQMFALDGYEGDDLIGTIAKKAQIAKRKSQNEEDIEVVIVTGDRDMLQLVDEHTKILMPLNGLGKTILYDSAKVEEKYGVRPDQFIDYKALIGDQSDGYPGITGIGPKTAANLLQEFGTFEALYERIGELPEKTALKLATDAEQGALAKKLATIITDAPFQFDLVECARSKFAVTKLHAAFVDQGFKTLTRRLEEYFPETKSDLKTDQDQLSLL